MLLVIYILTTQFILMLLSCRVLHRSALHQSLNFPGYFSQHDSKCIQCICVIPRVLCVTAASDSVSSCLCRVIVMSGSNDVWRESSASL